MLAVSDAPDIVIVFIECPFRADVLGHLLVRTDPSHIPNLDGGVI